MSACIHDLSLSSASLAPEQELADLAQIIRAYNDVTEKLQRSHESLRGEVVRLQRQLASTDAQLQRSRRLAALGEMAAGIAHEIRNPLGAIHLYAQILTQDLAAIQQSGTESAQDVAQKIAEAVRGLNAVVTDVLNFARELRPRKTLLDARSVLSCAVEANRPAIDAAGVRVVIDAAHQRLLADPGLLHQALLNLIRNAVEAMTPGGGILTLTADQQDGQAVLVVRDTGSGIHNEDVDRIFNPFFTTRNTGTGLGLAIVHRIVDVHGGAIAVRNDRGAVFTLSLPLPLKSSVEMSA